MGKVHRSRAKRSSRRPFGSIGACAALLSLLGATGCPAFADDPFVIRAGVDRGETGGAAGSGASPPGSDGGGAIGGSVGAAGESGESTGGSGAAGGSSTDQLSGCPNPGEVIRVFDICEYYAGEEWSPTCFTIGTHVLSGTPLDDDISSIQVADGYRVELIDVATDSVVSATLGSDSDLCDTPSNDQASKLVVEPSS